MLYPVLHITACSHRLISAHDRWVSARRCKAGRPGKRTPVLVRAREAQVHLRGKAPRLRKQEGLGKQARWPAAADCSSSICPVG